MRYSNFFYKFLCLSCFIIFCVGCKKSAESYVKEATDAMNEEDYAKAYSIVDVMSHEYSSTASELNNKIINNEITSLFEKNDPFLFAKINKIIKERLPLNVDGYIGYDAEKILSQINSTLSNAIEFAFTINNIDLVENLVLEYIKYNNRYREFDDYTKEIFYTNILIKLIKYYKPNVGEIIKRILFTYPISKYRIEGVVEKKDYKYIKDIIGYNEICNNLFNSSISGGRYDIAEILTELFKEDPEIIKGSEKGKWIKGEKVDADHVYIQYNWNSKKAAEKKLNEAKKNR